MFVERAMFGLVRDALDAFTADPSKYEMFLVDGGLTNDEVSSAVDAFRHHPPKPIYGYARQGGPIPCYALVLGGESIDSDYIGEDEIGLGSDGELVVDPVTGDVVDVHIRRWTNHFDWYVYADHPDLTLYYYYLLRHILVGLRTRLQADDFDEITFSGADLAPDPRFMPADLFTRRFSITFKSDETYIEDFRPGINIGDSIRGLSANDGTDPGDGTKYGITPYGG